MTNAQEKLTLHRISAILHVAMDNTNQTNSPSTTPEWLKTLSIGFAIVSFGIAIGVIGFVLVTKKNQTAVQNQQLTPSPTFAQPSPTPIDETSNWKTYTDPNHQFLFKYPPDLPANIAYEKIDSQGFITGAILQSKVAPGTTLKGNIQVFNLSIYIWHNTTHRTNAQRKEDLLSAPTPPPGSYGTRIRNISDYHNGEVDGVYHDNIADQDNAEITGEINDKSYSFSFSTEGPGGETRMLIDKILSTFKFTNQESQQLGNAATRGECLAKRGVWQKWGLAQLEYCQIPAPDSGKSCTDASQCTYECISTTNTVPGKCATYKNTFGCFNKVRNGKTEQAVCAD